MTTYKTRIATAIATGSVLLHSLAGVTFAATTITVTGNGADSTNTANVSQSSNTSVVQNNTANISNNVDVNASTGGNDANRNTGGNVRVDTGNATTNVTVNNTANQNAANVEGCGTCAGGNTTVNVSGNGAGSNNTVDLNRSNNVGVYQTNNADVENNIDTYASTGYNDANRNTGGDVRVTTGDAKTKVNVGTNANVNTATVGGGNSNGGGLSAVIMGNGADSDNYIDLGLDNSVLVTQSNYADVENDVDVDATTGGNDANRNTGGDVTVETGNANADITVDNNVNFNSADVENCGCLEDITAKIAGNGADSYNTIDATFGSNESEEFGTFQGNSAGIDNDLNDVDLRTGRNDANANTGEVNAASDPSVTTGDANGTVHVSNNANVNAYGSDAHFDFPNMNVHFSFDWNDLMDWLMSNHN